MMNCQNRPIFVNKAVNKENAATGAPGPGGHNTWSNSALVGILVLALTSRATFQANTNCLR